MKSVKRPPASTAATDTPEGLAKRMFLLTLVGMVAYVGFVIAMMSSLD